MGHLACPLAAKLERSVIFPAIEQAGSRLVLILISTEFVAIGNIVRGNLDLQDELSETNTERLAGDGIRAPHQVSNREIE